MSAAALALLIAGASWGGSSTSLGRSRAPFSTPTLGQAAVAQLALSQYPLGDSKILAETLAAVDASDPSQRALLAPAHEALQWRRETGRARIDALDRAGLLVGQKHAEAAAAAYDPNADDAALAAAQRRLKALRPFVELYAPAGVGALEKDEALVRLRRLREKEKSLRGSMRGIAAGLSDGDEEPGHVPINELFARLPRGNGGQRAATLDLIARRAENSETEAMQRLIVGRLVQELGESDRPSFSAQLVAAIESVAADSDFDNVRRLAIEGIGKRAIAKPEIEALTRIGLSTPSREIRALALARLEEELAGPGMESTKAFIRAKQVELRSRAEEVPTVEFVELEGDASDVKEWNLGRWVVALCVGAAAIAPVFDGTNALLRKLFGELFERVRSLF